MLTLLEAVWIGTSLLAAAVWLFPETYQVWPWRAPVTKEETE